MKKETDVTPLVSLAFAARETESLTVVPSIGAVTETVGGVRSGGEVVVTTSCGRWVAVDASRDARSTPSLDGDVILTE